MTVHMRLTHSAYSLFRGVLWVFIFLNCIFYRSFSYISFGENIYITEIFILLSVLLLVANPKAIARGIKANKTNFLLVLLFIVYGLLLLVKSNSGDVFFKIREFAAAYYSVFFIFIIFAIRTEAQAARTLHIIIAASAISMILIFFRFVLGLGSITTTDGVFRYGSYEIVGLLIMFSYCLASELLKTGKSTVSMFAILLIFFCVNVLIAHRSGSIALAVSAFVVLLGLVRNRGAISKYLIFMLLALFTFLALALIYPELIDNAVSRITNTFSRDIYFDPNASWRLEVWSFLVSLMNPIQYVFGVGWGYEVPLLTFLERNYAVDGFLGVHNSFLYIFFHMGIIGLGLLVTLIFVVYKSGIKAAKKSLSIENKRRIYALIGGNAGIIVFSFFNVVLEGPYMSIVFWTSLGLISVLSKIGDSKSNIAVKV